MFVDLYCFHIEALSSDEEIENLIKHIKEKNMKVGIAIKPKTPSSVLYPWISSIDMALVMVPFLCPHPPLSLFYPYSIPPISLLSFAPYVSTCPTSQLLPHHPHIPY